MKSLVNRRSFITASAAAVATSMMTNRVAFARPSLPHPDPRPGITGKNVLTKEQLAKTPEAIPLFDGIRAIPEIADGIRCNCGCPNPPELRSLLSCFEGKGMARDCVICRGQAQLAIRLHKEGKTLAQIRTAIDAKFA